MEMPAWQVHEYNPNFFILRESGCIHYEKPFLYLIFGKDKALLEDTGAGQMDTAAVVKDLIAKWAKRNNKTGPVPLIVLHSHSHGDHTAGDAGVQEPAERPVRCRDRAGAAEGASASRPGRPISSRSILAAYRGSDSDSGS